MQHTYVREREKDRDLDFQWAPLIFRDMDKLIHILRF